MFRDTYIVECVCVDAVEVYMCGVWLLNGVGC